MRGCRPCQICGQQEGLNGYFIHIKLSYCVVMYKYSAPVFGNSTIGGDNWGQVVSNEEETNLTITKQRSEGVRWDPLGTHGKRMRCLKYRVHAETLGEIGTHARKKKVIQEYILQDLT